MWRSILDLYRYFVGPKLPAGAYLEFTVRYPKQLTAEQVQQVITDAGRNVGIGWLRPRFGRFETRVLRRFSRKKK